MHEPLSSFDEWLGQVRSRFTEAAPDLLRLFDTYSAEAVFGRLFIAGDLAGLQAGARVLEVGAGSLLLSCQLVREGFEVTALEPIGGGFSHFDRMRTIVLEQARAANCCPQTLNLPAEALSDVSRYNYAFSVNVMEHVDDVGVVLANVGRSLVQGAKYRFTCPNYIFPYEPHFDIPTLFSKKLTEKVLGNRILHSKRVADAAGTWQSLNWINVIQVERHVRGMHGFTVVFNRSGLVEALERTLSDPNFASRRSPFMRGLLVALVRIRVHKVFRHVPALLQPTMDCSVERASN